MKPEEILKRVQKMYRKKTFELDEEKENIVIDTSYSYEKGGEYYSDDRYTETVRQSEHFCTVEFAKRMLTNKS